MPDTRFKSKSVALFFTPAIVMMFQKLLPLVVSPSLFILLVHTHDTTKQLAAAHVPPPHPFEKRFLQLDGNEADVVVAALPCVSLCGSWLRARPPRQPPAHFQISEIRPEDDSHPDKSAPEILTVFVFASQCVGDNVALSLYIYINRFFFKKTNAEIKQVDLLYFLAFSSSTLFHIHTPTHARTSDLPRV